MMMLRFIIVMMLFSTSVLATGEKDILKTKTIFALEAQRKAGVRYHKQGNYKKAYEKLSESAQWGMKQSQYLLGVMYLKGQYVDQRIDVGMAWLGVANEIDIKAWHELFDNLYEKLNAKQKVFIDKKVASYIEYYGMKTMGVSCQERSSGSSRNVKIHCDFIPDALGQIHELEAVPEGAGD